MLHPFAPFMFGKFAGGTAANIIPDEVVLEGTIRALSEEVRQHVCERLEGLVSGLEKTFRVLCNWQLTAGVPVLYNDEKVAESLYDASVNILGPGHEFYLKPAMGSEDFSLLARERPSSIMRIGCRNKQKDIIHPLHSPNFDLNEDAISMCTDIFY